MNCARSGFEPQGASLKPADTNWHLKFPEHGLRGATTSGNTATYSVLLFALSTTKTGNRCPLIEEKGAPAPNVLSKLIVLVFKIALHITILT